MCYGCGRPFEAPDCVTYKESKVTKENQEEQVDHPSHYGGNTPYEVIKVIEAWEKQFPKLNFNRLTAIKYIPRAGVKDPSKELQDLKKARWYLDREIKRMEGRKENPVESVAPYSETRSKSWL